MIIASSHPSRFTDSLDSSYIIGIIKMTCRNQAGGSYYRQRVILIIPYMNYLPLSAITIMHYKIFSLTKRLSSSKMRTFLSKPLTRTPPTTLQWRPSSLQTLHLCMDGMKTTDRSKSPSSVTRPLRCIEIEVIPGTVSAEHWQVPFPISAGMSRKGSMGN